ncbi:MAG: NUDIX domain-containing protein [Winogradskyella sp.]|nr:NUDIX domain-containing protein [Winogradskyella sp.]MBT8375384.1 NUDIX domain-containing protein [Bacteroidia bacterium]NNF85690.1 NUDIX domain-containing protein [Winogradskyella sp.]NNK40127.1 NUDIX domain-containing protein [Winogradskyella sp.]
MLSRLKNIKHNILSNEWATLLRVDYDYKLQNGKWVSVSRESYDRGNGASIFLYNSKLGQVILTKQFRMPAYINDTNDGESIEVCAGAVGKDEDPLECIIREVEEEVGYRLNSAIQVLEGYTSPGAVTEKMYFFIAEFSENQKVSEGGGLDSEDEDIEVLKLPFKEAYAMIETGRIKDAKSIILLQYAKLNSLL